MEISINDKCEAFDYAIALSDWLSHNYEGQSCDKYAAYCKITGEYQLVNRSSIDYDNVDTTQENEDDQIIMIYSELDENNWENTFNKFCEFMDNKWNDEE